MNKLWDWDHVVGLGPCGNILVKKKVQMNVQKEGLEAEEKLSKKRRMNVRKLR